MLPKVTRYDYRNETPGDGLRLVELEKTTRNDALQLEKELCANGGTTLERLHELLALHTIAEVNAAIMRWGIGFESHLGQADPVKPKAAEPMGWLEEWELKEIEREEEMRKALQGGAEMHNRGVEKF